MLIIKRKGERQKAEFHDSHFQDGAYPDNQGSAAGNTEAQAMQPPERGDRVRLCVDIMSQQHRKLKVHAAQQGIRLNELIEQLADRLFEN